MKTFLRNIAVSYTTIKSLSFHEDDYLIFYRPIIASVSRARPKI